MNTCVRFMHLPKIVQIGKGHHVNFCIWKKSAITFGEGCTSDNINDTTTATTTIIDNNHNNEWYTDNI